MRGGDPRRSGFARHLAERVVADESGARLGREAEPPRLRARVPLPREEGEPEPPRVGRNEREVAVGFSPAPAVVNVRDGERPWGRRRELRGSVQEGHGVRAARDGEQDRRAGRDESLPGGSEQRFADCVHSSWYDASTGPGSRRWSLVAVQAYGHMIWQGMPSVRFERTAEMKLRLKLDITVLVTAF